MSVGVSALTWAEEFKCDDSWYRAKVAHLMHLVAEIKEVYESAKVDEKLTAYELREVAVKSDKLIRDYLAETSQKARAEGCRNEPAPEGERFELLKLSPRAFVAYGETRV